MQIVTLNYLYRDSSNYKNFGSINFSNPTNIPIEEIENAIQTSLIDGEYFVAEIGTCQLYTLLTGQKMTTTGTSY